MNEVRFFDTRRQNLPLADELENAFSQVLRSGQFILGSQVEAFEREMAEYLGVPYTLGVSSGTDALLVALMTLGVGPGDEVIVPTFTFVATAGVVARLGARPVFADVSLDDFCILPEEIDRLKTSRTAAVIPVHLFGQAADMRRIKEAAGGVPLVEDCAQALGAELDGKKVGTLGVMGAFSFFPTKNLGGLGDGGLVSFSDPNLYEKAKSIRVHGEKERYLHQYLGGNFRLDAVQAAFLRVKLKRLGEYISRRKASAAFYDELLSPLEREGYIRLPRRLRGHTYNQYVIMADRRDELREFMAEHEVGTAVYYPIPLHLQPCFREAGGVSLPNAEQACKKVLALPIYPELSREEIERVVDVIVAFYRGL